MMLITTKLLLVALTITICTVSGKPQDKKPEIKTKKIVTGTIKKKTNSTLVTVSKLVTDPIKIETVSDEDKKKIIKIENRDKLNVTKTKSIIDTQKKLSNSTSTIKKDKTLLGKIQKLVKIKSAETKVTPDLTTTTIVTTVEAETTTSEPTTETTVPTILSTIKKDIRTTIKYTPKQGFVGLTQFSFGGLKNYPNFGSTYKKDDLSSQPSNNKGSNIKSDDLFGLSSFLNKGGPKLDNIDPFGLQKGLPKLDNIGSFDLSSILGQGGPKTDDSKKSNYDFSSLLNMGGSGKGNIKDNKNWAALLNLGGSSKPGSNAAGISSLFGGKLKPGKSGGKVDEDEGDSSEE